jgi:uncharacterized protein YndB with AHSA1/START domain
VFAARRFALIAAGAALVAACGGDRIAAEEGEVVTASIATGAGERALRQSIVVPALPAEVWRAWTTTEGFSSWAAPVASVDFRLGGIIEASYDPKRPIGTPGNIRNQIVAYVPERMLAIRNVQAPPNVPFDVAVFQSLQTVVFFEPAGAASTLVTAWQPGYRQGEAYDQVWKFFERGNAATLVALRDYLAKKGR